MKLLVLQHIACEPPGAYEDELLAWLAAEKRLARTLFGRWLEHVVRAPIATVEPTR